MIVSESSFWWFDIFHFFRLPGAHFLSKRLILFAKGFLLQLCLLKVSWRNLGFWAAFQGQTCRLSWTSRCSFLPRCVFHSLSGKQLVLLPQPGCLSLRVGILSSLQSMFSPHDVSLGVFPCVADRVPSLPFPITRAILAEVSLGATASRESGRKFRKCWSLPYW